MKRFTIIKKKLEAAQISKHEAIIAMFNGLEKLPFADIVKCYNIYAELEKQPHIHFMEELDEFLYGSPTQILNNVTEDFKISDKYFIFHDISHFASINEDKFDKIFTPTILLTVVLTILENAELFKDF